MLNLRQIEVQVDVLLALSTLGVDHSRSARAAFGAGMEVSAARTLGFTDRGVDLIVATHHDGGRRVVAWPAQVSTGVLATP